MKTKNFLRFHERLYHQEKFYSPVACRQIALYDGLQLVLEVDEVLMKAEHIWMALESLLACKKYSRFLAKSPEKTVFNTTVHIFFVEISWVLSY